MSTTLETPSLAPANEAVRTIRRRPFGLKHALHAAGAVFQWRLLLWWAILLLLPAMAAALPVWQLLSVSLDHSVHAPQLASGLDMVAIADLGGLVQDRFSPAIGSGSLVALALTLLLSPLLTGMTITAVRAPRRLGFMGLLGGGGQEYGRMLRMLIWAAIPLGIVGIVAGIAFDAAGRSATTAVLEADAERASHIAMVVSAIVFVIVHATIDAGRALLANERRRRSAIVAWWGGVRLLLRRPLALLGSYVVITAIGLTVAALLVLARVHVPALGVLGTIGAFLLTQLAVIVVGWMRSARLFALMALARDPKV